MFRERARELRQEAMKLDVAGLYFQAAAKRSEARTMDRIADERARGSSPIANAIAVVESGSLTGGIGNG